MIEFAKPGFICALPVPDGSVGNDDRSMFLWLYAGIALDGTPPEEDESQYDYLMRVRMRRR